MVDTTYDGTEIGVSLNSHLADHEADEIFYIKPPNYKDTWKPIYDEEVDAITGFVSISSGVRTIYDLEGKFYSIEEQPLEEVYFLENIVFLFVGLTELKAILQGGKELAVTAGRQIGRAAFYGATAALVSKSAITGLRVAFRVLIKREIFKFTATTAARMATKGRYVPTHVLALAIKYGKKAADPQGAEGAFQFVHEVFRLSKNGELQKYTIEIIVRVKDWTILHFHMSKL